LIHANSMLRSEPSEFRSASSSNSSLVTPQAREARASKAAYPD
jgi:hypothetical protein